MEISTLNMKRNLLLLMAILSLGFQTAVSQTLAFPDAQGFGRFAMGARAAATREVYIVSNLNDSGAGSFRDAVSKPGRIVVFTVGGIVRLVSDIVVSPNVTIAAQTAPGDGIVFFNKRVTFTGADNTICRYLRVRLGATNNSGNDASGLAHGSNIIFDHMSVTWGMDENFSINWDSKGSAPDNITIQNSIIGQALHRENHSAGGLIQTPDGGKVSLIQNLYISNKTRNPKVKGVNEFVNNVVYNWGNGNRLGDNLDYGWSGEAYIMGGSSGVSEVNIINNYFVGGPLTPPSKTTPFSRGTGTFNVYGSGNFFDNNRDGVLDGSEVPFDSIGYPGISGDAFKTQPFAYPAANPALSALDAYQYIINNAGSNYPRRDPVDALMIDEVVSRGTKGYYVYRESDLPLSNGGLGDVFNAPAPSDTDKDGMPDAWEDSNGLNKNDKTDAVAFSSTSPEYLNIEVYVNSLTSTIPPAFVKPPSSVTLTATSQDTPLPNSTVVVKWKDNSDDEVNFVLERSADGTSFTDIAHPAADAVSYTDNSGLLPNKTYYYRLKAVSSTDVSAYSVVASVLTPQITSAPSVPANPSPANGYQYASLTSGKLTLKWTGSSNTVTYSIYLGTDTASLVKQADIAYAAAPSYQVSNLAYNTTYFWRIDAVNSKGTTTGTPWSFKTERIIPTGIVGYYAFDETAEEGNKVIDSTAYANTGFLGIDGDNSSVRVTGKLKNGLDFATADPSIYVVNIPNKDQLFLDKSSFSISFWMKAPAALLPPDNNTSSYLLCKGSITRNATTGATGKRMDIEFKNKQFRFALDDDNDAGGGGKDELSTDGTPFFTNSWVHVVVIRDVAAKKMLLYRNGSLVKTISIAKSNSGIGEASALVLGNIGELEFLASTNKPAPYKGMLDEVRIYNYVLPASEVTALSSVKNTQTITFNSLPAKVLGQPDFGVSATASSGFAVSFNSSDTSVATISNGIVHIAGVGSTTITASQNGNSMYNAAAPVSQLLTVVPDTIPPTVPGDLAATATDSTATLNWTASTDFIGVTGYKIYKDGVLAGTSTATSFTVTGLRSSVTYAFTVVATDNAGNVSDPASISVTTPDTQAPSVPQNLAANKTTAHQVSLSWTASTDNVGVTGYNIYQNGVQLNTSLITGTTYVAERPIGYNLYEFTVKAVDAAGNSSAASNAARVQNGQAGDKARVLSTANISGLDLASITESVSVYPNPSNGNFKVSLNSTENGKVSISVYNVNGALVKSINDIKTGVYEKEIKLQGIAAGIYYIKVNLGKATSNHAFVVN